MCACGIFIKFVWYAAAVPGDSRCIISQRYRIVLIILYLYLAANSLLI